MMNETSFECPTDFLYHHFGNLTEFRGASVATEVALASIPYAGVVCGFGAQAYLEFIVMVIVSAWSVSGPETAKTPNSSAVSSQVTASSDCRPPAAPVKVTVMTWTPSFSSMIHVSCGETWPHEVHGELPCTGPLAAAALLVPKPNVQCGIAPGSMGKPEPDICITRGGVGEGG